MSAQWPRRYSMYRATPSGWPSSRRALTPILMPSPSCLVRSFPNLPWSVAAVPESAQEADVAQRVHRLPEPLVAVGGELTVAGEPLERIAFPDRLVAVDVVEHAGLEHEEA